MDYRIQILSFLCSFLYGIFFYLTSLFHYHLISKYSSFLKYFITIVYTFDVALLYVLLMYKVNYGVIHIYFVLVLFLGFFIASIYSKKCKKKCKIRKNKLS